MGISYILIHHEGDHADVDELVNALRNQFENIDIDKPDPQSAPALHNALVWEIYWAHNVLGGDLNVDRDAIGLEGYIQDVADFIVWYVSVIPKQMPLLMVDSGYIYGELEVTQATTAEEIINKFYS
jgi:hypothetical protein